MKPHAPGTFEDTYVLITESFTTSDGSRVHATEEWRIFDFDPATGEYWAYEVDKAGIVVALTDEQLHGRAEIISEPTS